MDISIEPIKIIDLKQVDETAFARRCADSVVVTYDGKLLLQQRPLNWSHSGGCLTTFGGTIELGEMPIEALIRELKEELGAEVLATDVVSLGALTEDFTQHTELVYTYFWHDRHKTITGCYEGEAAYFSDVSEVFTQPALMDYSRWMLGECINRKLLNA